MLGLLSNVATAFVYIFVALIGAGVLLRVLKLLSAEQTAWYICWLVLSAASFLSGHFLIYAVVSGICCAIVAKNANARIPATYIALIPVVPMYPYTIPGFLGINNIFNLDHLRVMDLALLLPAAILAAKSRERDHRMVRNGVDAMFFTYCAWLVLLAWLQRSSVTDSARTTFEIALFLLLPYVAISRLIRTTEDMRHALQAIVVSGVLMACVGIMEQHMNWYLYQYIAGALGMEAPPAFTNAHEYRWGFLRIKTSMEGGLGYFLVFALSGLFWMRRVRMIEGWRFWAAFAVFIVPLVFTGSRGAWIIFVLMLATTIAFSVIKSPVGFIAAIGLSLLAISTGQDALQSADPYGSFNYRARLLEAATPMVLEKPIFGWNSGAELFATGRLDHLRQGQGIIDIVNTYLSEALSNGIPGFLLFCGIFFCSLWAVLRRHHRGISDGKTFEPAMAAMLSSMVVATVFLLATISTVGHISAYMWLLAALCSAYSSLPDTQETTADAAPIRRPKLRRRPRPGVALKQKDPSLNAA
jgi:O-antigen ligase